MPKGTVLQLNPNQVVILPEEFRFSDEVQQVYVRVLGKGRILSPIDSVWDSFFLEGPAVTDDYFKVRGSQNQTTREDL